MTEQTKIPKMRVKLGEQNDLKFMLSIKGSTSDPTTVQPTLRFVITDAKTGISVGFPMKQLEGDIVGVIIPDLQGLFQEGVDYTGQLEVIVGSRWFNPVTVGLVFEREVKVEAVPILTKGTKVSVEDLQEAVGAEDEFSSIIKPTSKPNPVVNERELLDVLFTDKKETKIQSAPQSQPARKRSILNPRLAKLKKNLKTLISEAWCELE